VKVALVGTVPPEPVPERVDDFLDALPGPALFHVRGTDGSRTRVVAGSIHGNEPSGVRAIHRALRERIPPATDVLFYVGGVEAAKAPPRYSHRCLPGRRDPNRCFRPPWEGVDGEISREVLSQIEARRASLEVAVDLHNNTGRNPAYAIVPELEGMHLALALLFAPRVVHSRLSQGSFDEALERWCPSVTIECGQAHDPGADETAWQGLRRLLLTDRIDPVVVSPRPIEVFTGPVRVALAPGLSLAFADAPDPNADVTIDPRVDRFNFETLAAETRIGHVRPGAPWPLVAVDEAGRESSRDLFAVEPGGALITRRSMVPIMMTTHREIALSDCLFYAVHRRV
jgi:hypothetical protein